MVIIKLFHRYRHCILRNMAIDTFKMFDKYNIDYWTDYGTLLGLVRECDIIPHDADVDVCLFNTPDLKEKLVAIADELGTKYHLEYHAWGAYRIESNTLIPFHVDMYLIKEEGDLYVDPTGKVPKKLIGKRKYMNWKNTKVCIPEHSHQVLVWRYGKSYMTPSYWKKAEN